jgi:hypothetical protein
MTGSRRHAMQSARLWRRIRMVERRVAGLAEDLGAAAAAGALPLGPPEPATMLEAASPAARLNAPHRVPTGDPPLDGRDGGSWIV